MLQLDNASVFSGSEVVDENSYPRIPLPSFAPLTAFSLSATRLRRWLITRMLDQPFISHFVSLPASEFFALLDPSPPFFHFSLNLMTLLIVNLPHCLRYLKVNTHEKHLPSRFDPLPSFNPCLLPSGAKSFFNSGGVKYEVFSPTASPLQHFNSSLLLSLGPKVPLPQSSPRTEKLLTRISMNTNLVSPPCRIFFSLIFFSYISSRHFMSPRF